MNVREYLDTSSDTQATLAKRVGVTVQAISQYARMVRRPKPMIAKSIIAETGGAVTWDDLYPDHLREQEQAKEAA